MDCGVCDRLIALALCLLLFPRPLLAGNSAGQITGLTAAATRNSRPVKLKEDVSWNDVLQTDRSGRQRLMLRDGSIVSLGSTSELKIVQHDSAAQQTVLQLSTGQVRSRVVSITRPGGKFEVHTPIAAARVLGTDFFVEYSPASNSFRLICYSGVVEVAGRGSWAGHRESVSAGQMLSVGAKGFGPVTVTPNAIQQDSIAQTTSESTTKAASESHLVRNVLIGAAVAAAGVVVGLVTTGTASPPPQQSQPSSSKGNKPQ